MKPRVVFSPKYSVDYGGHDFAAKKFALTADCLSSSVDLIEPPEPSREDLLLAHDEAWVGKVLTSSLDAADLKRLELPFSPEISLAHRLAVGGTVLAARHALGCGVGLHSGGGAHHAFRDHGEGYCALNDIAVAILTLRAEGKIRRAAVIDLDVHQGNGTHALCADDPETYTFSMHGGRNYPFRKVPGTLDIELEDGTEDAPYLERLAAALPSVLADARPDLVFYLAGADPHEGDALGRLRLTLDGLLRRDAMVLEAARAVGVPVAIAIAGGYGRDIRDTVQVHLNTARLARDFT